MGISIRAVSYRPRWSCAGYFPGIADNAHARSTETSKAAASKAVDAVVQTIIDTLKAGGDVRVNGLGIFDVGTREARQGRNPQTEATIDIPASKGGAVSGGEKLPRTNSGLSAREPSLAMTASLFPLPALGSRCPVCRGWSWWRVDGSRWQCWECKPGPADWQAYPAVDLFNSYRNISAGLSAGSTAADG
jgi:DNA-binding protein HU-beta